jgi:DNA invertase Pin-like site-specific DNA recombinase
MKIGYARVSTGDQPKSIEAQEDSLRKAGCEYVYKDVKQSGGKRERPELNRCLEYIRKCDTLVVTKLDRLSRSLIDLLTILEKLKERQADFESLGEKIETSSPAGRMMLNMLGAFAQFEREIIRERVMRGLEHAKANGRVGGGQFQLDDDEQALAIQMIEKDKKSHGQVAKRFHVHRSTISRLMKREREKQELKELAA